MSEAAPPKKEKRSKKREKKKREKKESKGVAPDVEPDKDNLFLWSNMPKLPHPGKYEDINKEAKSALGTNDIFDGIHFDIQRGLSQNFSCSHSFALGSQSEPPSYNFGTSWVSGGPASTGEEEEKPEEKKRKRRKI